MAGPIVKEIGSSITGNSATILCMSPPSSLRTQVAIVGSGPAGLLLGQLLHAAGIDAIVIEQRSREYVLERIRAGVLEQGTVEMLDRLGVSKRLHAEGLVHDGVQLSFGEHRQRID